jgi:hypothetical protein
MFLNTILYSIIGSRCHKKGLGNVPSTMGMDMARCGPYHKRGLSPDLTLLNSPGPLKLHSSNGSHDSSESKP